MAFLVLISIFLWIPKTYPYFVDFEDPCDEEWVLIKGVCYQVVPELLTWKKADEFCKDQGGELLQSLGSDTEAFLEKTYHENGKIQQKWWVGQDLVGNYVESPDMFIRDSSSEIRTDTEEWGPSDTASCTFIIMDPIIQLVTTPTCTLKLSSICTLDFIGIPAPLTSLTTQIAEKSEPVQLLEEDPSHKLLEEDPSHKLLEEDPSHKLLEEDPSHELWKRTLEEVLYQEGFIGYPDPLTLGADNSEVPVQEHSSHIIWKRNVGTVLYQQDPAPFLSNMTKILEETNKTLQMALEMVEMMETGIINLSFEQKVTYLQGLLNATKKSDPERKDSMAMYQSIFKCTCAISLLTMTQCEIESSEQVKQISDIIFSIYEALSMQLIKIGDGPHIIEHATATIYTVRKPPTALDGMVLGAPGKALHCVLPSFSTLGPFLGDQEAVSIQLYSFVVNPLRKESNETVTGSVCSLKLEDDNAKEIKLYNLAERIQIFLPRPDAPPQYFENVTITDKTVVTSSFNITDPEYAVIFKTEPSENVSLQLLLAYNRRPNATDYDNSTILDNSTGYRWLISPDMLSLGLGVWYLNISMLNYTGESEEIKLGILSFSTKCMFWNKENNEWSTNGCLVGVESEPHLTQCLCDHLTFFGSNFFVMPNYVDLSRVSEYFARVKENYVVVVLLSAFFGLYLILLAWAIYADKQAFKKKKMTLLADNHPCAQYFYWLNVQTGHRRGAGTTAQVEFTLVGTEGQSNCRHLTDPDKPLFERGGVDMFLMATPFSLGELESIKLRHDDSGKSPGWYLSKVMIQDMQTRQHWHFLCSTWLSSSKGDGMIKKTFHSAKNNEITSFRNIFQSRTSSGFRDEHIWVSVVDPPRRSPFTRAQRVSCCMCLLLCTMAINIMFWNKPEDQDSPVVFSIGSLQVTWEDIMIGVESGLLMFPINILIITIFRSIRPRLSKQEKQLNGAGQVQRPAAAIDTFYKDMEELMTILSKNQKNKVAPLEKNLESFKDLCVALNSIQELIHLIQGEDDEDDHWGHCSRFILSYLYHLSDILTQVGPRSFPSTEDHQWVQNTLALLQKKAEAVSATHVPRGPVLAANNKKKSSGCWLPWWFVFVGWFLLLSISGISTFFTLLYGFVYGKESSTQWAISLALSLFQSIFILQPLKVVGVAIFFALILKTVAVEESEEVEWLLKEQREKCKTYSQRSSP